MYRRKRHEPESFHKGFSLFWWLGRPFRRLVELVEGDDNLVQHHNPGGRVFHVVLRLLWLPFNVLFQFIAFMATVWTTSRSFRAFLMGLPALALIGAFIATKIAFTAWHERLVDRRYTMAGWRSDQREDYGQALICWSRLVRENPNEDFYLYSLARSLDGAGDRDQCLQIMDTLAPEGKARFADAHSWMAVFYIQDEDLELDRPGRLSKAQMHMQRVLELFPDSMRASRFMGLIFDEQGRPDEAIRAYTKVVEHDFGTVNPDLTQRLERLSVVPQLAKLKIQNQENTGANMYLNMAKTRLVEESMRYPNNYTVWRLWADCCMVERGIPNYIEAIGVYQNALATASDSETRALIQVDLSNLYVDQAKLFADDDSREAFTDRLNLLTAAVNVLPRNGAALMSLIDLTIDPRKDQAQLDRWIREETLTTRAPVVLHVILAARAATERDLAGAKTHLDIADKQTAVASILTSDFAAAMSRYEPPQSQAALYLVDLALDTWPELMALYETRGAILMQLDRYEEAAKDMEHAVKRMEKNIPLREALADCYEKLNRPDDAAEQRAIVVELRAERAQEEKRRRRNMS